MNAPNAKAIAAAELLLRNCKTGRVTGFVAVATDGDDGCQTHMGGIMNLTATCCMLEAKRLEMLDLWLERFSAIGPGVELVDESDETGES